MPTIPQHRSAEELIPASDFSHQYKARDHQTEETAPGKRDYDGRYEQHYETDIQQLPHHTLRGKCESDSERDHRHEMQGEIVGVSE